MLIIPLVAYSLVTSFALRFHYNNTLMLKSREAEEARKATLRRGLAFVLLAICVTFCETDLTSYREWWSRDARWWSLLPGILTLGVLWVFKESTYKTQVLWHHYAPPEGVTTATMHCPQLRVSLIYNGIFWAFFLLYPGLPFYSCLLRPMILQHWQVM